VARADKRAPWSTAPKRPTWYVKMYENSCVTQLFGNALTSVVEDVTDHHPRTLGHERFGMSRTHPPRLAGDQHHLVLHTRHDGYRTPAAARN